MEMLINLLCILFWFFLICFNALMYFFAICTFIDRKTIRLGFSEMKPTWVDFTMIYLLPILLSWFLFVAHHEYNFLVPS